MDARRSTYAAVWKRWIASREAVWGEPNAHLPVEALRHRFVEESLLPIHP